ncbi:MAG: AraC family transcriptional regulator [Acidobacteriota bacterium]|nr:AraC family transcriptional regulator [Acidobacteriota bacterium]MDH3528942.1 AraC family transcriptional regulator [Acidobacteriota bacterium]
MSGNTHQYELKAGEHFGDVSQKHHSSSAVVSESVYKEQESLPRHSHELAFFTLVLSGNYFDKFCGKEDSFDPMTVLWREAGSAHKDKIGKNGGHFFFVEIKTELLDKLREYREPPHRFVERNGPLTWLSSRIRLEIQNWQCSSPLIIEGIALEMLGQLVCDNTSLEKCPPGWLLRVTEKLNEEFCDNIRIGELATEAKVHSAHLAKVFRLFNGQSIGDYVQERRIENAVRLLANKDIPIVNIAISSGFSDQSHFTRIFKRLTGMTPAAFRKSLS